MLRLKTGILLITIFSSVSLFAQQKESIKNYIAQYKEIAIEEMKRTGVPAAITLAQGIHESGVGQSKLAMIANNHFGIKCKSSWTGATITHTDDAHNECFRKYTSATESYKDHSDFLKNGQRYASLFSLEPTDYVGWANGLKQAGYATNPKYTPVLIKLIEDYNLQEYTLLVLGNGHLNTTAEIMPISDSNLIDREKIDTDKSTLVQLHSPVYPAGTFKINETKAVMMKKGESYLALAEQYNIDLYKLFEINDMNPAEVSSRDQLLYLQRKRTKGKNKFHTVQVGESMHDIAQAEAIRLNSLMELNWLETGMQPAPGETLSLQEKSISIPKLVLKTNYTLEPHIFSKTTH